MKYKIQGQGEPIIILRGLGRTFDYWLDFENELAKHFKVVMINLPGTDDDKDTTPLTIKASAISVVNKLKEIKQEIGEAPYNFFGLSLGGLTALAIAYHYPKLVKKVCAGASSITQLSHKRMNLFPLINILLMNLEPVGPIFPHKKIGKFLVSKHFLEEHPELVNIWDKLWIQQKLSKKNFFKQMVSALFSLTPSMLKKIKVPALILSGEEDQLVPFENSELIKNCIPNSAHISFPRTGHDLTTEHPELVAKILRDFSSDISLDVLKDRYQTVKESPEVKKIRILSEKFPELIKMELLDHIEHNGYRAPVYAFYIGHKPDPKLPTVAFFSCFHGVEWIGGKVLSDYIEHIVRDINWDTDARANIAKINICGIPVVNPVGRIERTRQNARGIDLMRNAPVIAEKALFLLGGQKWSKNLPWYMGEGIEKENQIVLNFLDENVFPSEFKITLDIHSAFLRHPRIWMPYASGKKVPDKEKKIFMEIKKYLYTIYKHHPYKYEKQTNLYSTHGDFWDYNFDNYLAKGKGTYLPLTLEISSYKWAIKNILSRWTMEAVFNPLDRRKGRDEYIKHMMIFDFIIKFAKNYQH